MLSWGVPATALCRSCGLCCDGTLFARAPLADGEAEGLRERGLEVAPAAGGAALSLPCAALADCSCTIYADRPASCRGFECRLLGALREGEVGEDEARELVADARSRAAAREPGLETLLDLRFRGLGQRR